MMKKLNEMERQGMFMAYAETLMENTLGKAYDVNEMELKWNDGEAVGLKFGVYVDLIRFLEEKPIEDFLLNSTEKATLLAYMKGCCYGAKQAGGEGIWDTDRFYFWFCHKPQGEVFNPKQTLSYIEDLFGGIISSEELDETVDEMDSEIKYLFYKLERLLAVRMTVVNTTINQDLIPMMGFVKVD